MLAPFWGLCVLILLASIHLSALHTMRTVSISSLQLRKDMITTSRIHKTQWPFYPGFWSANPLPTFKKITINELFYLLTSQMLSLPGPPHRVFPPFPQFASEKITPGVSLLLGLSHHQKHIQAGPKSQHICSRGLPCLDSVGEDMPIIVETWYPNIF